MNLIRSSHGISLISSRSSRKGVWKTSFVKEVSEQSEDGGFFPEGHIPYRDDLKEKAQDLRKNMTGPEKNLWYNVLRKNQIEGYRFLRQKPLLSYIVDFYCEELKLAIELDGFSHHGNEKYDLERTSDLE